MFKQFLGAASVATLMALGTLTYAQTYGQGSAGASTSGSTAAQPSGSPSTGVSGSAGAGGSVGATTGSAKCDTLMGAEKDRCLAEPRGAGAGVSGTTSGSVITPSTPSVGTSNSGSTSLPSVSGSAGAGATVGSTRCDSMNGSEKERCIREEGSASGSTGTRIPDAGNTGMGTDKPKQQ
jgi:pilus assembly protein FimV